MTEKRKTKRIPFDINVALRIKNGNVKGSFVKRNGKAVSWLSPNVMTPETYNETYGNQLFAETYNTGFLSYFQTDINGFFRGKDKPCEHDVLILLEGKPETVFIPKKYQSCVVRNTPNECWRIAVHTGHVAFLGNNAFYHNIDEENNTFINKVFHKCLPLNENTVKLVGTKNEYKENEKD